MTNGRCRTAHEIDARRDFPAATSEAVPDPEATGAGRVQSPQHATREIHHDDQLSQNTGKAGPRRIEDLDSHLRRKAESGAFSGTVLIAKDGRPLFHQAYGMASKRFGVLNREDTRYNLAAIGKLFTRIAMARLIQQGKVSADEPIGAYLEVFPSDVAREIVAMLGS